MPQGSFMWERSGATCKTAEVSGACEPEIVTLQRTLYNSRNPTRRWLHLFRRAQVCGLIEKSSPPSRSLALEVGPGSGVYLPPLCASFEHVTAIDIEPAHMKSIQGRMQFDNLTVLVGDFLKMKWEHPFDLILCSEVIEHVDDPSALVQAISRALRPRGLLIMSTPQRWSLMELTCRIGLSAPLIRFVRSIYQEPVFPTGHINLMSRRTLVSLLSRNGFSVVHSEVFGLYIPVLAEFGGTFGAKLAKKLQPVLQRSPFSFLLWTQLHLARRVN